MHHATTSALAPTVADLDRLGDEIAALSAHLDAATARLLALLREFDAQGGWANGFRSCAEWLSWRAGVDPGAARERVRVGRALGELPQLAAALARGELSYSKVRALTRVATRTPKRGSWRWGGQGRRPTSSASCGPGGGWTGRGRRGRRRSATHAGHSRCTRLDNLALLAGAITGRSMKRATRWCGTPRARCASARRAGGRFPRSRRRPRCRPTRRRPSPRPNRRRPAGRSP